jgi:hypothetical protein
MSAPRIASAARLHASCRSSSIAAGNSFSFSPSISFSEIVFFSIFAFRDFAHIIWPVLSVHEICFTETLTLNLPISPSIYNVLRLLIKHSTKNHTSLTTHKKP